VNLLRDIILDAREMTGRFWEVWATLCAVTFLAAAALRWNGWSLYTAFVFVVAAFGIFAGLMCAHGLGKISGYRETNEILEEARSILEQRREVFGDVLDKLDQIGSRFQGPS
jgi:Na+/H+ antiporter NhaC